MVSKGDRSPLRSPPPHCELTSHAAANLFDINGCTNIGRTGAAQNNIRPNRIADHGVHTNIYATPERMNPHENSLRRSPRLRKQREKDKETFAKAQSPRIIWYGGCNKIRFWSVLDNCIIDQRSCASTPNRKELNLYPAGNEQVP